MIDTIDKINWDEMPEGAIKFKLEDNDFFFAWIDESGLEYHVGVPFGWCKADSDDKRPHHKVSDHHPEMQPREWSGEGLPPVGTVCEVNWCQSWHECEIIAHFKQRCGMVAAFTVDMGDGSKSLDFYREEEFRPLRSERDEWVEDACRKIETEISEWNKNIDCSTAIRATVLATHDALKSGKLKAP